MATQQLKKSNQISFIPSIKTWRPFVTVEHITHFVIAHVLETRQQHSPLSRESFLNSFQSKVSRVRFKCLFVRHFFLLLLFISSYLIYRHSTRKTLAVKGKNRKKVGFSLSRYVVRVYGCAASPALRKSFSSKGLGQFSCSFTRSADVQTQHNVRAFCLH